MAITIDQVKELREITSASMMACKKALDEANGDKDKAIDILRKKGETKAIERVERKAGQGVIVSYIHTNKKVGTLVHLAAETDFVARTDDFQTLAYDIAMHVAAMNPLYLAPEDVSHELVEKEREIWRAQLSKEGKPEKIWDKIMEGKEKKFREESSLLKQSFVKNPEVTIEQLLTDARTKMGENIQLERFVRYSI